ncbi:unnamed protein product [Parascedosporium putredinis]|uniref:S-adenosyl-L-methionine-dependent methyltransferase n=1 Tax=Parascedosporium putredinis TaxID=1442378 RepID=A0A9P1MBD0_9PEZI|nr:unnamed protein product [Parascedosporium putredinis]CAI7996017.1 unnamed protein product [Parascedosporium putredinis]
MAVAHGPKAELQPDLSLALRSSGLHTSTAALKARSTTPPRPAQRRRDPLVDPLVVSNHNVPAGTCAATPTGRPTSLAGISAAEFDRELDYEESKTGVTKLREKLAGRAVGHVLEVAVGTGRNFSLYDWDSLAAATSGQEQRQQRLLSFTGLDIAKDMLDVAATKLQKSPPSSAPTLPPSPSSATPRAKSPPAPSNSSTAPSASSRPTPSPSCPHHHHPLTFGLCSVSDPSAVLSNLASALVPGTGRILLLEHGRGTWGIVNWWLDRHAPEHFRKYGCWWNRDLERIVRDAARTSGLPGPEGQPKIEVVRVERPSYQGGTVLWIELKVVE